MTPLYRFCGIISAFILVLSTGCFSESSDTSVMVPIDFPARAMTGTVPAEIESITISVSGPGMSTVTETFTSLEDDFILQVPSGSDRTFTVTATVAEASDSVVAEYRGTATANLQAGSSIDLPVSMKAFSTRILLLDPHNYQMVKINSFESPSIVYLVGNSFGTISISDFYPWDYDMDSQGRLYIANKYSYPDDVVIRIDDFLGTNDTLAVTSNSGSGVITIAIDRKSNIIYHSRGGTNLEYTPIDEPDTKVSMTNAIDSYINDIEALAVDDEGMLYIAESTTGDYDRILKIDPAAPSEIIASYETAFDFQSDSYSTYVKTDIMIADGSIYVTNLGGDDNYKIMRFNTDLEPVGNYGIQIPDAALAPTKGQFYGPVHFAAIRNDKLYIMDENNINYTFYNNLVSMDDMTGSNWQDFDESGNEVYFEYFYSC